MLRGTSRSLGTTPNLLRLYSQCSASALQNVL